MNTGTTIYNLAPEIMKTQILIALLAVFAFVACEDQDRIIPKPEPLIKEKQMIQMLVDIHIAEATYQKFRYDSIMKNNNSANFYYSVLDKYQVADSVFEKSFIYYASVPKEFERMYRQVMNELSETEQEYSGRKEELLQFDPEE